MEVTTKEVRGLVAPTMNVHRARVSAVASLRPLFLLRAVAVVGSSKRFEVISSGELST